MFQGMSPADVDPIDFQLYRQEVLRSFRAFRRWAEPKDDPVLVLLEFLLSGGIGIDTKDAKHDPKAKNEAIHRLLSARRDVLIAAINGGESLHAAANAAGLDEESALRVLETFREEKDADRS